MGTTTINALLLDLLGLHAPLSTTLPQPRHVYRARRLQQDCQAHTRISTAPSAPRTGSGRETQASA